MKVVIGAGPAGLYTAIKLRNAGIRDVVVYDPRAGVYSRPGHLNSSAFAVAAAGAGVEIDAALTSRARTGHIKDLERALYAEVERLRIPILQKHFVKFGTDAGTPGVVVANKEGIEEFIPADYVFDCTGTKRKVIQAVNELFPTAPPFKLVPMTEVPVSNHFIAYIKVPSSEVGRLPTAGRTYDNPSALLSSPLDYARNIVKLRSLGWNELKFPRAYHVSFGEKAGKHKVCLYLHTPEGLTRENYDLWVKTVLACYSPLPINYERLPDSKPRFLPFQVKAEALDKISFVTAGRPTIIPLGDSQIDFDYYLAHGIEDGMRRIDALFEHMEIIDGRIYYFDSNEYYGAVQRLIHKHKEDVIAAAAKVRGLFLTELPWADLAFNAALETTTIPEERSLFRSILLEIEARQSYLKANTEFHECHNTANELLFTPLTINARLEKLERIHAHLLKAHADLPASCPKERETTLSLLPHLAGSYKTIGNALSGNGRHAEAGDAYKKALAIYHLPGLAGLYIKNELLLYSNLAIMHIKEHKHTEAIATAKTALEVYSRCRPEEIPAALYEKIVFNLLKTYCIKIEELLDSSNQAEAESLYLDASRLMSTHATAMTEPVRLQIIDLMRELAPRLVTPSPALTVVTESPATPPVILGAAAHSSDIAAVGSTGVPVDGETRPAELTPVSGVTGAAETRTLAAAGNSDSATLSSIGLFSTAAVPAVVPAPAPVSFSCCGWFF